MRHILYLHGFHSSPNSQKAMLFKQAVESHFEHINVIAPQLCVLPKDMIAQVDTIMESYQDKIVGVVGSSLGGYLATYLHNKFNKPIVLINPAVKPFELLKNNLGEQIQPITGEVYSFTEQDINDLQRIYETELRCPENIWLLQQEKDEVLDYRQAMARYNQCKVTFELGGCHGFTQFERFPVKIVEFLTKDLSL
jgi:predicted esterase YcpF (UPF0227 family)